jgi:hypothetical protein
VITIQGLCSAPARKTKSAAPADASASCTTIVTKKQFESFLNLINPSHQPIMPAQRQQLAQRYVDLLTFANAARKAGIENKPQFLESLPVQRMGLLQQFYLQDLEEKYKNPSPQEIESYYKQNQQKYEEIKVRRIFIPKTSPVAQNKDEYEKKAPQVANDSRERAAKGEDPDQIQKDAYSTLGISPPAGTTDLGKRRRGLFPPQQETEIFALNPGEVTKVEPEVSGYVIYKVESKETVPMEQVKEEISRTLYQQKMRAKVDSLKTTVHADLDPQYFGPPSPTTIPPMPPGATREDRPGNPRPQPPAAPKPSPVPVAPSTPPPAPSPSPSGPPK